MQCLRAGLSLEDACKSAFTSLRSPRTAPPRRAAGAQHGRGEVKGCAPRGPSPAFPRVPCRTTPPWTRGSPASRFLVASTTPLLSDQAPAALDLRTTAMQTVASARSVAVAASYGSGTSMTRDGAPARRPSFAPPRRQPQQRSGFPEQPEAAATARWAAPAKPSDRRRRGGWCTALARPPTPSPGLPDAHHRSPASLELNPYRTRSFLDQPDNVKVGRWGRRCGARGGWLSQQIWGRLRLWMPAAAGRVRCTRADVTVASAMLALTSCRRRFGARTWHTHLAAAARQR